MTSSPTSLTLVAAREEHRGVLEQLWTMFRHDMSAFTAELPDGGGRFRQERLDAALSRRGWAAHLLQLGRTPVGLLVTRGLDTDEHVISSFFLVHGARRSGHGRTAVRTITRQDPGRWAVAFQDRNVIAARFWRAVASEIDPGYSMQHREVPGRPDLPPDAWIRFTVGPGKPAMLP